MDGSVHRLLKRSDCVIGYCNKCKQEQEVNVVTSKLRKMVDGRYIEFTKLNLVCSVCNNLYSNEKTDMLNKVRYKQALHKAGVL